MVLPVTFVVIVFPTNPIASFPFDVMRVAGDGTRLLGVPIRTWILGDKALGEDDECLIFQTYFVPGTVLIS